MPLDGHSFLVAQGWGGKGTGLRQGGISRPLAIPQKKTLAGLGKDRDEAFPFWDHLFCAAAKSIQVKLASDDEADDCAAGVVDAPPLLKRTATGILSNRRPVNEIVVASGSNTPDSDISSRYSLLTIAKREAAKRGLYARFFRGPVLDDGNTKKPTAVSSEGPPCAETTEELQAETTVAFSPFLGAGEMVPSKRKKLRLSTKDAEKKRKKGRKGEDVTGIDENPITNREERKRLRKERKEARRLARKAKASKHLDTATSKERRVKRSKLHLEQDGGPSNIPVDEDSLTPLPCLESADIPDLVKKKKKRKRDDM